MAIHRFSIFLFAVALAAGVAESSRRHASADEPAACPMYECKTIHAYWAGDSNKTIAAFFTVGGGEMMDNSSAAIENIFTMASVEKKPRVDATDKMDTWLYDSCSPLCGKDAGGKWQAPQEVGRAGKRIGDILSSDGARKACTPNGGQNGPTITNPTNANTEGYTPPGVKTGGL